MREELVEGIRIRRIVTVALESLRKPLAVVVDPEKWICGRSLEGRDAVVLFEDEQRVGRSIKNVPHTTVEILVSDTAAPMSSFCTTGGLTGTSEGLCSTIRAISRVGTKASV